jgi:hypothetical protein
VIPLNLSPGVMFEPKNVLLSLIIPGHPGNNMGVFMQPLWDELEHAWDYLCFILHLFKSTYRLFVLIGLIFVILATGQNAGRR